MKKRLAWIDSRNKVRIHPKVRADPKHFKGVKVHMETFQKERAAGASRKQAIHIANREEHKAVGAHTLGQIRSYELGNARLEREIKKA